MEQFIYLIVKVMSAAYLINKVFQFLSGKRGESLWHFLTPENTAKAQTPLAPVHYNDVVGKSQTAYLEEHSKGQPEAVEPFFSENLEPQEAEATEIDVEYGRHETELTEEDRFMPLDAETDGEAVSSGMTYDEISSALDVVQGKRTDEAAKSVAARILYEVQGSDLFNFLSAQAENEALVEKLIKENIDGAGLPPQENRRKRKPATEYFDMDRYV